jgi:hypothetical protein
MPRVQKHAYLAFEVRGKNLKPVNTNPVLHQFYYLLNELRFERGSMKIVVTDKDPAVLEQMDSSWVKGSIHLNMEVIGYREGEIDVRGLDHSTSAFILNELAKLKVEEGKIQINVIEATFSESRRSFPQVWPKEQIPIVGF